MSDRFDLTRGHLLQYGISLSIPSLQLQSAFPIGGTPVLAALQILPPLQLDITHSPEPPQTGPSSILTRPPPTPPPTIDVGDVITWITEAIAVGTGLGLVLGVEDRPWQALGGGLIMAAGEAFLLEMIDRALHGSYVNRWLCLGLSLAAGVLAGLGIQFAARLDRSGIAGVPTSDGRNPIGGFGP